jgi:hypothetical protein
MLPRDMDLAAGSKAIWAPLDRIVIMPSAQGGRTTGDAATNTAAAAQVVLVNGAQASNVYWGVTGAVGMGASTAFVGTVLTAGAVTVGAGAQVTGSLLSLGTVTLAGNAIALP